MLYIGINVLHIKENGATTEEGLTIFIKMCRKLISKLLNDTLFAARIT
jgi:hypothetical protein